MDQLIFKSKWEDDDQLPPLVEEVYGPMHQGQNIEHQSQSNTYLIDLLNIGYDGTTAIVCKNDKTIGDLKEMIYTKHKKSITQPDKWIISDSENEYLNNQLLNEIGINNQTKLVAIKKQFYSLSEDENSSCDGDFTIKIYNPERSMELDVQVNGNEPVGFLLDKIDQYLKQEDPSRLFFQRQSSESLKNIKLIGNYWRGRRIFGGCFPGFTPVQLYDGQIKQIKDVKIGDEVLSYDADKQQFVKSQIIALHKSKVDSLIKIKTIQGLITTTQNHPFFTEQGWKAIEPHPQFIMQKLSNKDKILNCQNQFIQIESIEEQHFNDSEYVYNITTRIPNSYVVFFGFVVHNMTKINIRINGKFEELEIQPEMKIQNIKILIQMKYGIEMQKQQLFLNSQELQDDKILLDYLKQDKSNSDVPDPEIQYQEMGKMIQTIDVKNKQNKNLIIDVKKNNNVKLPQLYFYLNYIYVSYNEECFPFDIQMNTRFEDLKKIQQVFELNLGQPTAISKEGKILMEEEVQLISQQTILKQMNVILITNLKRSIVFNKQVRLTENGYLRKLIDSFDFMPQRVQEIKKFLLHITTMLSTGQIQCKDIQKFKAYHILSIKLWTSNLVYNQVNIDLRNNKYEHWFLFSGIEKLPRSKTFSAGKSLQFSEVTCISKDLSIAKKFSNNKGLILEFDQRSSKDIESLLIFLHEKEIVLPPFSQFVVSYTIREQDSAIEVKLKEIPQPRWIKVLLWVDDKPQNNYYLAEEVEIEYPDISVVLCISTEEAIKTIKQNKWMIYLDKQNSRIVTDMVREENGELNTQAGIDFIYQMNAIMKSKKPIFLFCGNAQRERKST